MNVMKQLASRVFGVPLLIERNKLDVILAAIGPRIGVTVEAPDPEAYGPGDSGRSRKDYYVTSDGIAVIDIVGPLVKRNSGSFLSGGPTTYAEIESEFMDAVRDPAIAGILLQVDSPGGESTGCFELADLIYSNRGAKPIYAAADADAYSAAYALASSAERVFVSRSGGVGSVGVWMMHVDQSEMNAKDGVKPTHIFAGARKIDGNPHAPLTDEARTVFQDIVDGTYEMFVDTVARNRGMSAETVRVTEAGLYFGQPKRGNQSAVDIGFADEVGTLQDALKALTEVAAQRRTIAASAANSNKGEVMAKETKPAEAQEAAEETAQPEKQKCGKCAAEMETAWAHCPACGTKVETDEEKAKAESAAQLQALTEQARAEGLECAAQIVDLCKTAGKIEMAADFLKAKAAVEDVRAALLNAKADDTDADELDTHSAAGGIGEGDPYKPLAEVRAKSEGISFSAAYQKVVAENPKLYDTYLAARQAIPQKK